MGAEGNACKLGQQVFSLAQKSLLSGQRPNPGRGRQLGVSVTVQYLELLGPRTEWTFGWSLYLKWSSFEIIF